MLEKSVRAHAKTRMAPCTHGDASVAPLWRLSASDDPVTGACTLLEYIVALLAPWLLPKKLLPSWARGSRHALSPTLSRWAKLMIAPNIQNAELSSELQPEAMCNAMSAHAYQVAVISKKQQTIALKSNSKIAKKPPANFVLLLACSGVPAV